MLQSGNLINVVTKQFLTANFEILTLSIKAIVGKIINSAGKYFNIILINIKQRC